MTRRKSPIPEGLGVWMALLLGTGAITYGGTLIYARVQARWHGKPSELKGARAFPGLTAASAGAGGPGVIVTSVQSGSAADTVGVRVGDGITAVNRHPISSLSQAERYVAAAPGGAVELKLVRSRETRYVTIPAGRR